MMLSNPKLFNLKQLAIATSTLASLGILATAPARAAMVEFDLKFFENDVQVGFGEFSYDDAQPLEETFFFREQFPVFEIVAKDGWFELTSFSATIGDLSWDLGDSVFDAISWIPEPPDFSLGGVSYDREGEPNGVDFWLFGDPITLPVMAMFPDGSWVQSEPGNTFGSTWVAEARVTVTPVPEPSTTLLMSGLVLGGGSLLKKRSSGAKRSANGRG